MKRVKLPHGWEKSRPLMLHAMAHAIADEALFKDRPDQKAFENAMRRASAESGAEVCAFSAAWNHYHLLLFGTLAQISDFMHRLQTSLAAHLRSKYDHKGRVFFRPYLGIPKIQPEAILDSSAYVQAHAFKDGVQPSLFEARDSTLRAFAGLDPMPDFVKAERILNLLSTDPVEARRLYKAFVINWAAKYPKVLRRMSDLVQSSRGPNLKYPDRAASLISLSQTLLLSMEPVALKLGVPTWWLVAEVLRFDERLQISEIAALLGRNPRTVRRVLRTPSGRQSLPEGVVSARRFGTGRASG